MYKFISAISHERNSPSFEYITDLQAWIASNYPCAERDRDEWPLVGRENMPDVVYGVVDEHYPNV